MTATKNYLGLRRSEKILSTGRRAARNPALAAPYTGQPVPPLTFGDVRAALDQADYGLLEQRIIERLARYDSPAGPAAGRVLLSVCEGMQLARTITGNARQRRCQIRAWKRQGFDIHQIGFAAGTIIQR